MKTKHNIVFSCNRGNEGKDWRAWYSDECRRGKEMVMKAFNKWTRGKTCENRYELVERKRQYKEIMEKEKKKWQDKNVDNTKMLLRKKGCTAIVGWNKDDDDPSMEAERKSGSIKGKGIFQGTIR
jgi:hypothetical protein